MVAYGAICFFRASLFLASELAFSRGTNLRQSVSLSPRRNVSRLAACSVLPYAPVWKVP